VLFEKRRIIISQRVKSDFVQTHEGASFISPSPSAQSRRHAALVSALVPAPLGCYA
jgi:hypothetical protein